MTTGELAEVVAAGLTLGSHTCSHPSLPALPPGELSRELHDSRDALEQCVRRPITLFAYPFGHHNRRIREAVAAAGYDVAFTFLNGRIDLAADRFRLPRLTMTGRHGLARLTYHLYRRGTSWPNHQLEEVTGGDP